jgi:aconitate hydratase
MVQHADGSLETLALNHSYGPSQIAWFKRGSALNLFHDEAVS